MKSFSFPPAGNKNAKILILGTMPGKTSLEVQEYYGYKFNSFWKIMFRLFNSDFSENYSVRLKLLTDNRTALWDVLKYCNRKGSADSDIKDEIPNDFKTFYRNHSKIKNVFFNGKYAMKFYEKYIGFDYDKNFHLLPSTSPANARISFEDKVEKWSLITKILQNG